MTSNYSFELLEQNDHTGLSTLRPARPTCAPFRSCYSELSMLDNPRKIFSEEDLPSFHSTVYEIMESLRKLKKRRVSKMPSITRLSPLVWILLFRMSFATRLLGKTVKYGTVVGGSAVGISCGYVYFTTPVGPLTWGLQRPPFSPLYPQVDIVISHHEQIERITWSD